MLFSYAMVPVNNNLHLWHVYYPFYSILQYIPFYNDKSLFWFAFQSDIITQKIVMYCETNLVNCVCICHYILDIYQNILQWILNYYSLQWIFLWIKQIIIFCQRIQPINTVVFVYACKYCTKTVWYNKYQNIILLQPIVNTLLFYLSIDNNIA